MRDYLALIGFLTLGYFFLVGIGLLFSAPIWVQVVVGIFCAAILVRFVVFVIKQLWEVL